MGQSRDAACPRPARVVSWTFRFDAGPQVWDWTTGQPDVRALRSIRTPRSTEKSRHIPVQAYSVTLGGPIHLESGLEHDLVRELDRDPDVVWMVSQPVRLVLGTADRRSRVHTPDLLVLGPERAVTIWDVRPVEKQDEKFAENRDLTEAACLEVGWGYRVYGGASPVRRDNVRWLTAYRRVMPWYPNAKSELLGICREPNATVGAILDADRGAGHLISAMWHYAWTGAVAIDLDQPIGRSTSIRELRVTP